MHLFRRVELYFLLFVLVCRWCAIPARSQTTASVATHSADSLRDGQHDFDFDFGTWKLHISRLEKPLTGSSKWNELDGTVVVRKIWDGLANIAEVNANGPSGRLQFLALRLYNPESHQWSNTFASSSDGTLSFPMVGEFKNGRGEFIDQEPFHGRTILVRFVMWPTSPNSARSEQAFSDDGGKTWEVNWINTYTRVSDESTLPPLQSDAPQTTDMQAQGARRDGQHDFDFNFGSWKTHISRLQHPLTGSTTWVQLNGTVVVRKIWGGRAQLEEVEAEGANGARFKDLALFLYNPPAHQWSINFANSKDGRWETPTVGEFKDGRGEFYDQESLHGRAIQVRILWSDITPDAHHFEESYSDDGGKAWEPVFAAQVTRKD